MDIYILDHCSIIIYKADGSVFCVNLDCSLLESGLDDLATLNVLLSLDVSIDPNYIVDWLVSL